jgi:hypothetical protein
MIAHATLASVENAQTMFQTLFVFGVFFTVVSSPLP